MAKKEKVTIAGLQKRLAEALKSEEETRKALLDLKHGVLEAMGRDPRFSLPQAVVLAAELKMHVRNLREAVSSSQQESEGFHRITRETLHNLWHIARVAVKDPSIVPKEQDVKCKEYGN